MAKRYMDYQDWTQWAGDNPELAEAELRKESPDYAAWRDEYPDCVHEDVDNQGVCEDCGDEVEGWEPSETQMDQHYGTDVAA